MKTWVVIDGNNLCHRAFHAIPQLQWRQAGTGALFGFFRDVIVLEDRFMPYSMVFCFDSKTSHRKELCPTYKHKRQTYSDIEKQARNDLRRQMGLLQKTYLKQIGYRNIFLAEGFEADDIIASVCQSSAQDEFIIVSSDSDLYQLLREDNVLIWNPLTAKLHTEKTFRQTWGIAPAQWSDVKAIAGCKSDNVIGVERVGEIKAVQFLKGELPVKHKSHQAILADWERVVTVNKKLVTLPYPDTPSFELKKDKAHNVNWDEVLKSLGMDSLVARVSKRGSRLF